jgi:hypothetical protein
VQKSVMSFEMPVKDDGVTLMKDATAQFFQIITAKHTLKIICSLPSTCYLVCVKNVLIFAQFLP